MSTAYSIPPQGSPVTTFSLNMPNTNPRCSPPTRSSAVPCTSVNGKYVLVVAPAEARQGIFDFSFSHPRCDPLANAIASTFQIYSKSDNASPSPCLSILSNINSCLDHCQSFLRESLIVALALLQPVLHTAPCGPTKLGIRFRDSYGGQCHSSQISRFPVLTG